MEATTLDEVLPHFVQPLACPETVRKTLSGWNLGTREKKGKSNYFMVVAIFSLASPISTTMDYSAVRDLPAHDSEQHKQEEREWLNLSRLNLDFEALNLRHKIELPPKQTSVA